MSLRKLIYVANAVVGVTVCGLLGACGGVSSSPRNKAIPPSGAATSVKGNLRCVSTTGIKFVGGEIHTPSHMSGSQMKAILKRCGFAQTKVVGEPALEGQAKRNPRVLAMATDFAACMGRNGVHIPPPSPKNAGPLIDTSGLDLRNAKIKAALVKCARYLAMS